MLEAEISTVNNKFENFLKTAAGEDLFAKVYKVNKILQSGIMTVNEGLGMIAEEKVQGEYHVRCKSGDIRSVIMLGTNSYLNLSTHPQVIKGSKDALEKFGYGIGAASKAVI